MVITQRFGRGDDYWDGYTSDRFGGEFSTEAEARAFEVNQIPGLRQAADAVTGRAYPEFVAGANEYDPAVFTGRYYVPSWVNEYETTTTYVDPKYVSTVKGEPYYDEYTGRYETPDIYVSSGQSVVDQAMADPLSWVASNINWGGLGWRGQS